MMRDVCLLEAEEENFVHIVDTSTVTLTAYSQSPSKSYRFVVQFGGSSWYYKNSKLKSFLFINRSQETNFMASYLRFARLQLMRVLDISRSQFGEKLPSLHWKAHPLEIFEFAQSSCVWSTFFYVESKVALVFESRCIFGIFRFFDLRAQCLEGVARLKIPFITRAYD